MRNHAFKKMLAGVLAVLTVAAVAPVNVVNGGGFADSVAIVAKAEGATSGNWANGDLGSGTWKIENGTLTISGKGAMVNYDYATIGTFGSQLRLLDYLTQEQIDALEISNKDFFVTKAPWGAHYADGTITKIVIEPGITAINKCAFTGMKTVTEVSIPAGITTIGEYAFSRCAALKSLTIPKDVTTYGMRPFVFLFSLEELNIFTDETIPRDCIDTVGLTNQFDGRAVINTVNCTENTKTYYKNMFTGCKATVAPISFGDYTPSMSVETDGSSIVGKLYAPTVYGIDPKQYTIEVGGVQKGISAATIGTTKYGEVSYTCVAKEMADARPVTIKYGNVVIWQCTDGTASIKSNLMGVINSSVANPNTKAAAKAMLNYGAAAQTAFNYNTTSLANASLAEGDKMTDVSAEELTSIADGKSILDKNTKDDGISSFTSALNSVLDGMGEEKKADVTFFGMTLNLAQDTSIILYFRKTNASSATTQEIADYLNANANFTDGEVSKNNDNYIQVKLKPVGIKTILIDQKITCTSKVDSTITGTATVNVKNYFANAAANGTQKQMNVCKALYNFSEAAKNMPTTNS